MSDQQTTSIEHKKVRPRHILALIYGIVLLLVLIRMNIDSVWRLEFVPSTLPAEQCDMRVFPIFIDDFPRGQETDEYTLEMRVLPQNNTALNCDELKMSTASLLLNHERELDGRDTFEEFKIVGSGCSLMLGAISNDKLEPGTVITLAFDMEKDGLKPCMTLGDVKFVVVGVRSIAITWPFSHDGLLQIYEKEYS